MKRGKRVYWHLIIVSLAIVVMLLGAIFYSSGTLNKVGAVIKSKVKPPTAIKKDLITKLEPQFQLRQSKMAALIEKNPAAFLRIAYPKTFRDKLDPTLKSYVEEKITKEGTLSVEHSDDFEQKISKFYYYLNTADGQRFRLHFAEEGPALLSGSIVRVQGVKIGKDIAVRSSGEKDLQIIKAKLPSSAITNKPSPVTGSIVHGPDLQEQLDLQEEIVSSAKQQLQELFIVKKVAVIMFNFQNDLMEPFTKGEIREIIFTAEDSVKAYYQEASYGKFYLTGKNNPDGDIYGWFTVPYANTDYCELGFEESAWLQAANTAAVAAGADLSGYDNIIYILPEANVECGFRGYAQIAGQNSIIYVPEGDPYHLSYIVAHELGHNFGLMHAASLRCIDPLEQDQQITSAAGYGCESDQYGDPFDIMGVAYFDGYHKYHFNNYHKQELGLFSANQMIAVNELGEFELELTLQEQSGDGVKIIRVERGSNVPVNFLPNEVNSFYLEYRQPTELLENFDPVWPVFNGVSIRIGSTPGVYWRPTYLIDTWFSTASFQDAALAAGQTFVDAVAGISITTESISPESAQVRVTKAQPTACYQSSPAIFVYPESQAANAGQTLTYTALIENNDNAACAPRTMLVSLNPEISIPAGWSISPFSTQALLSPGKETTINFDFTSASTALPGIYTFQILSTGAEYGFIKPYYSTADLYYWIYDCTGGVCVSPCGNGVVNPGEDCNTCPLDVDCS